MIYTYLFVCLFIILFYFILFYWVGTSIGTWGSFSLHFNHVNMKSQRGGLGKVKSLGRECNCCCGYMIDLIM